MIKYAHLEQHFDASQMQREVQMLEADLWKPHYNQGQYEGNWATLALRSINGSADNHTSIQGSAMQENMSYKDTQLLDQCIYIKSVIGFF